MESSLKLAAAEEKERAREDSLKQYESAMTIPHVIAKGL